MPPNPAAAAPAPGLALPQADVNMVPQFGLEGAEVSVEYIPFLLSQASYNNHEQSSRGLLMRALK